MTKQPSCPFVPLFVRVFFVVNKFFFGGQKMSKHPLWFQLSHVAGHSANHGSKAGAAMLIVVGFCLAPVMIGIPLVILGIAKLLK
jgi:hypothetical protein